MDRGSEVRIGGPEQKLGSRARAGSAEARRCGSEDVHFLKFGRVVWCWLHSSGEQIGREDLSM